MPTEVPLTEDELFMLAPKGEPSPAAAEEEAAALPFVFVPDKPSPVGWLARMLNEGLIIDMSVLVLPSGLR